MSQSNLIKIAVTLSELRKAYESTVSPLVIRSPRSVRKKMRSLRKANKGTELENALAAEEIGNMAVAMPVRSINKIGLDTMSDIAKQRADQVRSAGAKERYAGQVEDIFGPKTALKQLKRMRQRAKGKKGIIYMSGDVGRGLDELLEGRSAFGATAPLSSTAEGREAFNRTIGLHERNELTSLKKAYSRNKNHPTFISHQGPQPMLNDVIIANTFKGKGGSDLRRQVMGMRAVELDMLHDLLRKDEKASQLIQKLKKGGRINRHQRKYLDRLYATEVLSKPF